MIERTGGVPLFIEELTRAVLESGDASVSGRQIPVTLHDSLMARLDRLGPAKEVAQVASVIGSDFSYELLHAVSPYSEAELEGSLSKLADAELIYVHGTPPEANYTFKHALVRDTAYEALLKSRRKALHRLVASTIGDRFPAFKQAHPEVLARHWTEAGDNEPAISEWFRAGESARARNAFSEALESYQQAVAALSLLPESQERNVRELDLRQFVSEMLFITKGYSASETTKAIEQAGELAEKTGNLSQLVSNTLSRILAPLNLGDTATAAGIADQALELALREGSPSAVGMAHAFQTVVRWNRGDLTGAEQHYTEGLKFWDDPTFRRVPGAALWTYSTASRNAWMLGRASLARERIDRMRTIAERNNPYDSALLAISEGILRNYLGEHEQAESLAIKALDLSEKNQFLPEAAYARVLLGSSRAQRGCTSNGISLIRQGIEGELEIGARVGIPSDLMCLAEAQMLDGAIIDGVETIERSLGTNPDQLAPRPEMMRLRGELRLKQTHLDLAESDFRQAIELAQKMKAKGWELRTIMSLARLLRDTGRRIEAEAMLEATYNWFTEGFDTADLKEAKALLDQLSA
jgi:tetratricopeptide (TPR) repeat protein